MISFIDNTAILHIELGAGCNNFGQQFYPACLESDADEKYLETCNPCYLDLICDAYNLPFQDNRFEIIIACNPSGYGFRDDEKGEELLLELIRVLRNNGKILLISSDKNPFGKQRNVAKRLIEFREKYPTIGLNEEIFLPFLPSIDYPNFTFYQTNHTKVTLPNQKMQIYVTK